MCQTVNENAHGLKGNNPDHKLRILKVFRVTNGSCECLGEIRNRSILVVGIPDRRNPLKNDLDRIHDINWPHKFLELKKLNIIPKLCIIRNCYGS